VKSMIGKLQSEESRNKLAVELSEDVLMFQIGMLMAMYLKVLII